MTVVSLMALSILAFVLLIAPFCSVASNCSMHCCEGKSRTTVAQANACGEPCAISNEATAPRLPDAVPGTSQALQLVVTVDAVTVASALPPAVSPPAFSRSSHHAVPGDAPVYLQNSAFLI